MAQNTGIVARVQAAIARCLTGFDLRGVVDEQARLRARIDEIGDGVLDEQARLRARIDEVGEAAGAEIEPMFAWMRGAEEHLAGIQAGYERLLDRINETSEAHTNGVTPILSWIRGAEAHLTGLQSSHERLGSLLRRHDDQLTRLLARLALLESRLGDLERADTAIAAALAATETGGGIE